MSLDQTHWIFRYKLHHIPLWFAYHFLWWTMRIGSPVDVFYAIFYSPGTAKFFFYLVFQALAVYFNLYFLIPRFLEKRKYLSYVVLLLITIVCASLFIVSGYYFAAWYTGRPMQDLYGVDPSNWYALFEGGALPSTAASMTLAMSIKLASDWLKSKRRQQLLEKEKLETELKFLRSQFNPHFLFNTINSIFVLINKNPAMASEALAKFSELLRYQLYECNEDEISVRQELTYLENFIELEKLRHSAGNLAVDMNIARDHEANLTIAPFVLIPFVENAFKHVSRSNDHQNRIKIELKLNKQQLLFSVENNVRGQSEISREVVKYDGIGLKNVRRRLDLIYGKHYDLTAQPDGEKFVVMLVIDLHAEPVASISQPEVDASLAYTQV